MRWRRSASGSPALRNRLINLDPNLEAFPEVPATLQALKERGLVTAILSNGTPKMLEAAIQAAGLTSVLDVALSVEEVGLQA